MYIVVNVIFVFIIVYLTEPSASAFAFVDHMITCQLLNTALKCNSYSFIFQLIQLIYL